MKFDTIIIGGGLSGLVAGIRLSQKGQRCAIVSSGQNAMHFSSGSFDLLNMLPDGTQVSNPTHSIKELIDLSPSHPYSKIGTENFSKLTKTAESFFAEIGISMHGTSLMNHYRITPLGTLKSTWLTNSNFASSTTKKALPWKKVSIFNIQGFLDFSPSFIENEFEQLGVECETFEFSLPEIDLLRRNPSELRSTNIAKVLDTEINILQLAEILKANSEDSQAIILPACLGLKDEKPLKRLTELVGKPIYLIPTLPPSIIGIRMQQQMRNYFTKLGGTYMLGDTIKKAEIKDNTINKVYSCNHGDIPFVSKNFILATGSYFSQGLIASKEKIYEPVFNLDIEYITDRDRWNNRNVFEPQNYLKFGVKTDESFKAIKDNKTINNLYIAGAILEGFDPIKEGCGAGVSILSALHIANNISVRKEQYELAKA